MNKDATTAGVGVGLTFGAAFCAATPIDPNKLKITRPNNSLFINTFYKN